MKKPKVTVEWTRDQDGPLSAEVKVVCHECEAIFTAAGSLVPDSCATCGAKWSDEPVN